MQDFTTALARFIELAPPLAATSRPLTSCLGAVLAENIVAPRDLPGVDTSAMDGYALSTADITNPIWRLSVEGESKAGSAPSILTAQSAMRIFTGAPVPSGANAVVMQEDVARTGVQLRGSAVPRAGQHIRQQGEELGAGTLALARGTRVTPNVLALLGFLGQAEPRVSLAPKVAILCTGSELYAPGEVLPPGAIYESNSLILAALCRQAGSEVITISRVDDDLPLITQTIAKLLTQVDVLLTVGGVSVGDYDHIPPALQAACVDVELCRVAIKPGKPILLGTRGSKRVIGLPGNPVSAVVTFALLGMPLLRAMQGDAAPVPTPLWVAPERPLAFDAQKTRAILGILTQTTGTTVFAPLGQQSSASALALARSDGIALLPPGNLATTTASPVAYHEWRSF